MAAQLGFCGLDRGRQPLRGDEIRGCWEGWPTGVAAADRPPTIGPARPVHPAGRAPLEFIEVTAIGDPPAGAATSRRLVRDVPADPDPGWDLWGDPER